MDTHISFKELKSYLLTILSTFNNKLNNDGPHPKFVILHDSINFKREVIEASLSCKKFFLHL